MSISPWKAQCVAKNAWLRHRWCGHRVTYGHSPCSGAMSQSITTAWSSTKPICLTMMPCGNGWVAWWNLKALAHAKQGYFGRTGNGTIPVGPRGYPHCYGSPWLISQRKPWWHQRGRSRWVLAMKKCALLHIYLPQFAMSASLPLLSKRAQYAQCTEKSQLLHHISMPVLLSHSIWYMVDHMLLYFASTFDEISERTPQKASELLCRGFSPKTSLPPYRCGWRSLCPGCWKGTFAQHFPTSRSRCFGWCFSLTDQVIETKFSHVFSMFAQIRPVFFSRYATEEALGDDLVFQSSVDLEDVKISEGMKAGKFSGEP